MEIIWDLILAVVGVAFLIIMLLWVLIIVDDIAQGE